MTYMTPSRIGFRIVKSPIAVVLKNSLKQRFYKKWLRFKKRFL